MSVYNRVTPRTVATLLRWTTQQPWGDAFRDTLPVGGVDGTLRRRFAGTSLEGRIFAKTGTLMGTNALSGFLHDEERPDADLLRLRQRAPARQAAPPPPRSTPRWLPFRK